VRGTLFATSVTDNIAAPPISMVGRIQRVQVALPSVQIRDTTCGTGDLHLRVSISEFAHVGGRPSRLVPLFIQAGDARHSGEPVTLVNGTGTSTLVNPPSRRPSGPSRALSRDRDPRLSRRGRLPRHRGGGVAGAAPLGPGPDVGAPGRRRIHRRSLSIYLFYPPTRRGWP
jgi:hypothetical protein